MTMVSFLAKLWFCHKEKSCLQIREWHETKIGARS